MTQSIDERNLEFTNNNRRFLKMADLDYVAKFHDHLDRAQIMLAYDGVLSSEIVEAFISRLKQDIEAIDVPKKERKRFFSIVVECIQNIAKHGNVSELKDANFLVVVEKEQNTLKISTGNVVKSESEEMIQQLINYVNTKNEAELKALYKEGVRNNTLSEKGEASLGLIDIARKSSKKLQYQFKKIDEKSSYFLFQTQIHVIA